MSSGLRSLAALLCVLAGALALAPAAGGARAKGGGAAGPTGASAPFTPTRWASFAERAANLVARMTLAEKASQMVSSQSPAIPRLGISAWGWWNEALHGVADMQLTSGSETTPLVNTTIYPDDLALASTWDPSMAYDQGSAISDEARDIAPGNSQDLDFYAPTVNLSRDPRWGRNDETYSEDPFLTGAMSSQWVNGFQGQDSSGHLLAQGGGYFKAIATPKHYAANNTEQSRLFGSSNIDERALREYYTAQFQQIIQSSHPGSLMTAFNAINGRPSAVNDHLVEGLARRTYGFNGYITSDCDGIDDVFSEQHWHAPGSTRTVSETEARAIANSTGVDLNCTLPYIPYNYASLLPAATGEGIKAPTDTYNVQDMDASVVRLLSARMELGDFGNTGSEPWVRRARSQLSPGWVNSDANSAESETPSRLFLAREVADRGMVLLNNATIRRNDGTVGPVLPISVPRTGPFKVAVIGYFANHPYFGDYSSEQASAGQARTVSPYAGLKAAIQAINPSAQVDLMGGFVGGTNAGDLQTIDPSVVPAAAGYNDVVVVVGTDASTGTEGSDRYSLALPGAQGELIRELGAENPNTVAVLETAGDVDVSGYASAVPAMVWSGFNGQQGGEGVADVLLGSFDPSGHLPFTWYQSDSDVPSINDYRIRPGTGTPGRTYMYYRGPVSFPFGWGLSYTTFSASNLRFDRTRLTPNDTLDASVNVTNAGGDTGEDLVQLYVTTPGAGGSKPIKRLEGFQQVELAPGQTKAVSIQIKIPSLGFWNGNRMVVEHGLYGIQIGSSADNVLLQRDVYVSGKFKPVPATVSAFPQMPGDGARGIKQRIMFPVGTTVLPQLSISMNDESLYGYVSAGHSHKLPSGMRVSYSSDRPKVVSVSGSTIRTAATGVATVTATVTYDGHSASTQFVVRALAELTGISIKTPAQTVRVKRKKGGKGKTTVTSSFAPLPGFHPDTDQYDVLVPRTILQAPRIRVTSPDRRARVRVQQAATVPGTTVVSVTGPDGLTSTYRINFARPALSQSFAAALRSQWKWIRLDPASASQAGGALTIAPEPGDLYNHTARNILLEPALGDWTIESRLAFSSLPSLPGQQGGIIAYQDDQNYLKLDLENAGGVPEIAETTVDSLSGQPTAQVLATAPAAGSTVWLRMTKRGPHYTTSYSFDGVHFARLYTVGADLTAVQAGLFAFGQSSPSNGLSVSFANFYAYNHGPLTLGYGALH